jgi:hypothetical protein
VSGGLSEERLAEIRECKDAAADGPYIPQWSTPDDDGERVVVALRLPEPTTRYHVGEPREWEFWYEKIAQFTPETAVFLAHSRQFVGDLLAEVDRLNGHVEDLQDKVDAERNCACSYDDPNDICLLHSPVAGRLRERAEKAETALRLLLDQAAAWAERETTPAMSVADAEHAECGRALLELAAEVPS